MLLADSRADGEEDSPLDAPEPTGALEIIAPSVSGWVRVRRLSWFTAKLAVVALVLTIAIAALPFGKPDGSEIVAGGGVAQRIDRSTTTIEPAVDPSSATARGEGQGQPFEIDVMSIAPVVPQAGVLEEVGVEIEPRVWVEPDVEPESAWIDSGNGVRLPDLLLRIRFCESTNNYRAANSYSSARGAYQFLTKSWNYYGHAAQTGAAEAHLATPAQQDEAALGTYRRVGARPWAESRGCWGGDSIDPRYLTAQPTAPAPTTTTVPPETSSTTVPAPSTNATPSTSTPSTAPGSSAPTTTAPTTTSTPTTAESTTTTTPTSSTSAS